MPQSDHRSKEKKTWALWLLPLFLLAVLTSSIAGYILGRNVAPQPTGQILDTILLDPGQSSARTQMHLTGRVVYSDGAPAANCTLELHSDPATAITDANGRFLFPNVPFGEHTLLVRRQDGSVAAQRAVKLNQEQAQQGVVIAQQDTGDYAITLSVDIRVLEIQVELNEDQLYLLSDHCTYANETGWITTPEGIASTQEGVVVTPSGSIHLPDGAIVIPGVDGIAAVILPDDTVLYPEHPIVSGDSTILPDGTVNLPDGVQIGPDGSVKTPDGTESIPGTGGIVTGNGTLIRIGGERGPGVTEPSAEPGASSGANTPPFSRPESTSDSSRGDSVSSSGSGGGGGGHTGGSGSSSSSSSEPEGPGILTVQGETGATGSYASWTQISTLDLFYNRTGVRADRIAPGSFGFYRFRLQNTRASALDITMTLSEQEVHLPLSITLSTLGQNTQVSGSIVDGSLVLHTVLPANAKATYQLEWKWPLEGNDSMDTVAGSAGTDYALSLTVHAEEK